MGMAVEASLENWDKVSALAAEDLHTGIGTYYYNLSNAVHGTLADRLLDYYQPFERGLFLPVGEHSTPFQIACAGDVWFVLGDMSMAERDAMLGMLFSPAHTGSRYLKRLAEANLVKGDFEAASKFLKAVRNFPAILIPEHSHTGIDISRLASSQPAGPHDLLDLLLVVCYVLKFESGLLVKIGILTPDQISVLEIHT